MQPSQKRRKLDMHGDADREVGHRLVNLLHTGRCSIAGLHAILGRIKENPSVIERDVSMMQLRRFNRHAWNNVRRHRLALPGSGGGIVHLNALDPGSLLSFMLQESALLQRVYGSALARSQCYFQKPWDMVLNFDELSPGNKLHVEKCMNLNLLQLEDDTRLDHR